LAFWNDCRRVLFIGNCAALDFFKRSCGQGVRVCHLYFLLRAFESNYKCLVFLSAVLHYMIACRKVMRHFLEVQILQSSTMDRNKNNAIPSPSISRPTRSQERLGPETTKQPHRLEIIVIISSSSTRNCSFAPFYVLCRFAI
jgi:hypothetical protein